jgi:lipopolysaccharide export LptBFGC system permease protein LptF
MNSKNNDYKENSSPYSSLMYSDFANTLSANQQKDERAKEDQINYYNNNTTQLPEMNQTTNYSQAYNYQSEDQVRDSYINKVKHDSDFLPVEYRSKINFANKLFTSASIFYPCYFLFHFLSNYPDVSGKVWRKIGIGGFIYVVISFGLYDYMNKTYPKAYSHLRNKYSADQINEMIENYKIASIQNLNVIIEGKRNEH